MIGGINPVAFRLFGIPIMWYGVLIATGVFLGSTVASKEAERKGLDKECIYDILLWALPASILGARLYYVFFEWSYYSKHPGEILAIRNGGMAIHGGLFAAFLVSYLYCRKKKLPFIQLVDCVTPGIPLGQAIGRWGNFINQEAYGRETSLPWGIWIEGKKVHPTFLYESIGDFLIFLFLLFYARKKQKKEGELLPLYMIFYGILRFFVEGLRTDSLMFLGLRIAQVVSLVFVLLGLILFFGIQKKGK